MENTTQPLQIVATSNTRYLKFLIPFITSIQQNCGDNVQLHIRLVNVPQKYDEILLQLHDRIILYHDNRVLSTKRNLLCGDNNPLIPLHDKRCGHGRLISEEIAYCSNIRFDSVLSLLRHGFQKIVFMDVDAIVRQPLTQFEELLQDYDLIIRKDSTTPYVPNSVTEPNNETYRQGIFVLNNTLKIRELYHRVDQQVKQDMKNWDIDQIAFYHTFEEMKKDIRWYNLPLSYRDTKHEYSGKTDGAFNKDSHIWSGSYVAKYTEQEYIDEMEKYWSIAQEKCSMIANVSRDHIHEI